MDGSDESTRDAQVVLRFVFTRSSTPTLYVSTSAPARNAVRFRFRSGSGPVPVPVAAVRVRDSTPYV